MQTRTDDERYIPRVDQNSWNLTPSEAATTVYAESMAETSIDGQSRTSIYTYASGDAQKFLKKVDNRSHNALSETYYLPTDDDEWSRLDKQHVLVVVGLSSLYPQKEVVQAILAPEEGVTKRILDLGCGTGVWTTAMAVEFPHADVLGVDLAPTPIESSTLPPNCRFEIDDINLGLPHFKEKFDLIHLRLVATGLRDFRKTMTDVHSCLKPGGMIIWVEGDYDQYYGEDRTYIPPASDEHPSGSWSQRFFYEIRRSAVKAARSDLHGMESALDAGLWDDPLLDPETCRTASLYNPIGPWLEGQTVHQTQQLKYVGSLVRQDMISAQQTVNALLKFAGWPQPTLDDLYKRATEELMENKLHLWGRMRLAWGRRRKSQEDPVPSTSASESEGAEDNELSSSSVSPHYYVYKTKEEARLATEARNLGKDIAPLKGPGQ